MDKMSIRIILKNGVEFTIKCNGFVLEKNVLGEIAGYKIDGVTENKPVYIDFEQIAAIVRVLSDEHN